MWLEHRNIENLTPLDHAVLANLAENNEMITIVTDAYLEFEVNIMEVYFKQEEYLKNDNILHLCAKVINNFPMVLYYLTSGLYLREADKKN